MPTPTEIPFSGACDRATFYRAVRLASYPPPLSTALRVTLALAIFVVYAALIVIALRGGEQLTPDLPALAARLFTLPVLLYLILRPFIDPLFLSRKLWQLPANHSPLAGVITGQGVTLHNLGGSRELGWDKIARAQRTKPGGGLLVLLASDGTIIPLPRSFFQSEEDWAAAARLAQERTARVR